MKLKTFMVITASVLIIGANLFVISARQGNVNSKMLLSKALSFNHFAYATDPGNFDFDFPTGEAYPNGFADCSVLDPEVYSIDVKLNSDEGQKLKKYLDAGGNLSTIGVPYVSGKISLKGGNNSSSSSNNSNSVRIVGNLTIDVRAARPQYIYCDYRNYNLCRENTDPCNKLKLDYFERALSILGL